MCHRQNPTKVLSDPNGKVLLESDYVTEDVLNTYYRGLILKNLLKNVWTRMPSRFKMPLSSSLITLLVAFVWRKEISCSSDKELFQHPEKGKFFVNAIFTANELHMNGNVAVDREDFIWLL